MEKFTGKVLIGAGYIDSFAVSYILDKGVTKIQNMTDKDVEKMRSDMKKEEKKLKKEGKIMGVDPDFAASIANRAREMVKEMDVTKAIFDALRYAEQSREWD